MSKSGPVKFLYDVLENAERLTLPRNELSAYGNKSHVTVEKSKNPRIDFETTQTPKEWPQKILELSPEVYIDGQLETLSSDDSKDVANSLFSLQKKQPELVKYIDALRIYGKTGGTTAMWQNPGWGGYSRHVLSTKTPASELHRIIDSHANLIGLEPNSYEVLIADCEGVGKGVKLIAKDRYVLDVFSRFVLNGEGLIKNLQIGEGNEGKMKVNNDNAENLVFPTPLRRITHADVNCFTTGNGSMINNFLNIKKGAVYASDEKLEVMTKTPERMKEIVEILF